MTELLMEALEQACYPDRLTRPHARPGTTLGDWQTFEPAKQPSVTLLRRRMLLVLEALPEDMTVAELREELE